MHFGSFPTIAGARSQAAAFYYEFCAKTYLSNFACVALPYK